MAASEPTDQELLRANVSVPEHVVYRDFAEETVILNLDSGMYHGLNGTAAKMLETLSSAATVDAAIAKLIDELAQPREVIEPDVLELCKTLAARGLIAHDGGAG
jgi:hypothetical protein